MTNSLAQFQQWYRSNCDGDWEHTHGVSISTLDNPAWTLKIELTGTSCSGRDLARSDFGDHDTEDTWHAH